MNLEEQVISLELAKRLKELGVEQNSMFKWRTWREDLLLHLSNDIPVYPLIDREFADAIYSAFTVAELGKILPDRISWGTGNLLDLYQDKNQSQDWQVAYVKWDAGASKAVFFEVDQKEADARAKMLIYLIEKGMVKP